MIAVSDDAVARGWVTNLRRPGGNITGLSFMMELNGKRLELLHEALPNISRIAVMWNAGNVPALFRSTSFKETKLAARALGLQLHYVPVRGPHELDGAFTTMTREHLDAFLTLPDPMFWNRRTQIADPAAKNRLPAIFLEREFVEAGGLMSYGPNVPDMARRAAGFVDRILKGAKPGDLPVEQPTQFVLATNLKTAKALGLTIPQSVLLRADDIIR